MKRILTAYEQNQILRYCPEMNTDNLEPDIPIEYVTGWCQFGNRDFRVSQETLIPRIETEELAEMAVKELETIVNKLPAEEDIRIADVGTGSGVVGICVGLGLERKRQTTVWLSDISEKALTVAKNNMEQVIKTEKIKPEIKLVTSYLFNAYPGELKFHLVTANLPYIPTGKLKFLPKSVINYEPVVALDGGPKGLSIINKLLEQLPDRLENTGVAVLEIDNSQQIDDFTNKRLIMEIRKDSLGENRFLIVKRRRLG